MQCVRKVTEDLYWVGANDKRLNLFENIHPVPKGISYNSYLLLDEKTVLFDTCDRSVSRQFMQNVEAVLNGRPLNYLVINHMEPDHGASVEEVLLRYPDVVVVCTAKAVMMLRQFGFNAEHIQEVKEGDTISFGRHEVTFVSAPMVHWPEVMATFDKTDGVLFSADAFGTFGSLDGRLFADEMNFERELLDEARRYYTNIVGKYGPQVQKLLKKSEALDIRCICPLHGPVWRKDIDYFLKKYDKWSSYEPEEKGVLIAYASMYGNTESTANIFAGMLCERGMSNISMYDVSVTPVSYLISDAFKYSHIALFSATYNLKVFPIMQSFLDDMTALNLQKRVVGIVENGSWAPQAGNLMAQQMDKMKEMTVLNQRITVVSALNSSAYEQLEELADSMIESMRE